MNRTRQMITISVLLLFICSCTSDQGKGTSGDANKASAHTPQKAEAKLPDSPGVYYQSDGEMKSLMENPTVSSENPSFLIVLENQVPVEKLRLRLGKYPSPPKLFSLEGEPGADVFEATVKAVENQDRMYRASYSGKLDAGKYISYYFTDASKGKKPWAEAQFKLAGIFPVK